MILYYVWFEDLLGHIKIKLPCIIFKRNNWNKEVTALRTHYENETRHKELNTSFRYQAARHDNEEQEISVNSNISNAFTKVEFVIPTTQHQIMQKNIESDVDYFNLADNTIRFFVGNETDKAEHSIEANTAKEEHDFDNVTNRLTLRSK